MLPDFPELRGEFDRLLLEYLRNKSHSLEGITAEIPHMVVHEGNKNAILREDGTGENTEFHQAQEEVRFAPLDYANLTLKDIIKSLDTIAESFAEGKAKFFFRTIDEAVKKVGNVVDAGGKPMTANFLFKLLRKTEISFNSSGEINGAIFVASPAAATRIAQVFTQIENDPKLAAQFAKIINKKREAFRAKEADRILVG